MRALGKTSRNISIAGMFGDMDGGFAAAPPRALPLSLAGIFFALLIISRCACAANNAPLEYLRHDHAAASRMFFVCLFNTARAAYLSLRTSFCHIFSLSLPFYLARMTLTVCAPEGSFFAAAAAHFTLHWTAARIMRAFARSGADSRTRASGKHQRC